MPDDKPETASTASQGGLPLGDYTLSRFTLQDAGEMEDWARNEIERNVRSTLSRSGLGIEAQARLCAEAAAKPITDWDLYDWIITRRGLRKALTLGLARKHGKVKADDLPAVPRDRLRRTVEWLLGLDALPEPTPGDAKQQEETPDPPPKGAS